MDSSTKKIINLAAFRKAEISLYYFTALQNAGYVLFILFYSDFVQICDPKEEHHVWLASSLLFVAVLLANLFAVFAGFESDLRGHAPGIRKSFDFGILHGVMLALLPWVPAVGWTGRLIEAYLFFAVMLQMVSSAYVNASYHAWFFAAIRNLGYDSSLDSYTSRRRLTANLVWLVAGVIGLWLIPFLLPDLHTRVTVVGGLMAVFYGLGSVHIRRIIRSSQDIGSFETPSSCTSSPTPYSTSLAATSAWKSFTCAWEIIRSDISALLSATLWVTTWTLGVVVLYFWQETLEKLYDKEKLAAWYSAIWIVMTLGRVIGNQRAVLPSNSSFMLKAQRIKQGAMLNGLSMILLGLLLVLHTNKMIPAMFEGAPSVVIAVLLLVLNRVGQEVIFAFAYARLHETKGEGIAQNRGAVESFLSVWTTVPVLFTWGLVSLLKYSHGLEHLIMAIVFAVLGFLVVLCVYLNRVLALTVYREELKSRLAATAE